MKYELEIVIKDNIGNGYSLLVLIQQVHITVGDAELDI